MLDLGSAWTEQGAAAAAAAAAAAGSWYVPGKSTSRKFQPCREGKPCLSLRNEYRGSAAGASDPSHRLR